ncbi:MAG: hypothetical protein JRD68_13440 [Deltaproteobacteria bacterium]|nr:hypothetical protein [Deltaproteobacteria bacterium]
MFTIQFMRDRHHGLFTGNLSFSMAGPASGRRHECCGAGGRGRCETFAHGQGWAARKVKINENLRCGAASRVWSRTMDRLNFKSVSRDMRTMARSKLRIARPNYKYVLLYVFFEKNKKTGPNPSNLVAGFVP